MDNLLNKNDSLTTCAQEDFLKDAPTPNTFPSFSSSSI
jgi:hypothetical protein